MPAVAAVVAAEVVTAELVVAAITQIGIGLSVVGAVTGNKTLMAIGGVMGIAGGVASLASGATAGAAATAGGVGYDTAATMAGVGGAEGAALTGVGEAAAADGLLSTAAPAAETGLATLPSSVNTGAQAFGGAGANLAETAAQSAGAQGLGGVQTTMGAIADPAASASLAIDAPGKIAGSELFTGDLADTVAASGGLGAKASGSDWLSIFKSKEGMNSLMQLGGGALKGLADDRKLDLEREMFDWKRGQTQQAVANANAVPNMQGMIQAVRGNVFGAPAVTAQPRVVFRPR